MQRKCFLLVTCLFFSLQAASYEGKIGIDFRASGQTDVGLKWHFSQLYCFNPYFGMFVSGNNSNDNNYIIGIGNQFYLPSLPLLDHYIDVSPALIVHGSQGHFLGDVSYGVQHQLNAAISLFGELGIEIQAPDFYFATFRTGIGAVFYFK